MATGAPFPLARRGIMIAVVLALSVAACGRRGALESPGATDPAVSSGAAANVTGSQARPLDKPQRDFILDAII